jgi:hypothetical protein
VSVSTLYKAFDGAIKTGKAVDVLGSEIGGDLNGKLGGVPPIARLLGDAWTVQRAATKDLKIAQEEREVLLPRVIPQHDAVSTKRSRDDEVIRTTVTTRPANLAFQLKIRVVNVAQSFNLEGRIGDDILFFGHFWQEGKTLKYYILFGFPTALVNVIFADVYCPELAACTFSRVRVLVFSHQTSAFHTTWGPGVYFLSALKWGKNLWKAAGPPEDPLFFGGSFWVEKSQIGFKLWSWPGATLKFDGGRAVIDQVRLEAFTQAWSDGEVPRTIEGDDPEEPQEDDSPEPLDSQFALVGRLSIGDLYLPVWSPLPPDDGLVCFNPTKSGGKLPDAAVLDALVGEQGWLAALTAKIENYRVEELAVTVHLPTGKIVSVSYTLFGTFFITGACPEKLTIDPARISCIVSFPGDEEAREEQAEVEGRAVAKGAAFQAHLTMPEKLLRLSSEDSVGFDAWSQTFWFKKREQRGGWKRNEIEGIFTALHVEVDLTKERFWASVSNEEGEAKDL